MKKGKEKKEENYIKRGGKGIKNASFWAINLKKKITGGSSDPPLQPPAIFRIGFFDDPVLG